MTLLYMVLCNKNSPPSSPSPPPPPPPPLISCRCIMQCARSESCRKDIIERRVVVYAMEVCRMYSRKPDILRSAIVLFSWTANTITNLNIICDLGGISTTLKCMKRHLNDHRVVSPGMQFISRAAKHNPSAVAYMLKNNAIEVVVGALRALISDEMFQVEGLRLLQLMARTTEGWNQISKIKGGWQVSHFGDSLKADTNYLYKSCFYHKFHRQFVKALPLEMHWCTICQAS